MLEKLRKRLYSLGEAVELVMAGVIVCAIFVGLVALVPEFMQYWGSRCQEGAFLKFMESVLDIVIGIEFVKVLCKPDTKDVIEVLVFFIARFMIVHETSAAENLLAVVSICILFFSKRFIDGTLRERAKEGEKP